MTDARDIVDRLRYVYAMHPMVMEAAEEIERLREELTNTLSDSEFLRQALDFMLPLDFMLDEALDDALRGRP